MARKLRLEFAGACYHVINRGNYRRDLFRHDGAAAAFQECLFEACARFRWRLHAYVIMRNHYHLAVETPEPNLSEGMKWLQGTWAARFNRFRAETGRPFQGRFKALHVEPGPAVAQVAHYIHLNPVRARIATPEQLPTFPWSSLRSFITKPRPPFLVPTVLQESGSLTDTPTGWKRYVEYLAVLAEEEPARRTAKFGRLSTGWAIGSAEFKQSLKRELQELATAADRFELLGADKAAHREARRELWEEKLTTAATTLNADLTRLPPQKSAPEKVVLAALMKAATSVSNGWLAERLQMGPAASVSQYVRRFHLAGLHETAPFKQAASKL